ncbi:hypothetical protein C8F04DRAFT_1088304 [Mycena alexandri]|uniref:Uncharacterized protein n=1 Tax=Mycena alexandri TaxID=1745969 RepID=A0AAD6XB07_9AGAR|nr:hypothetical protein C8F04DRAFT_1088304 [Mycena alexandri]
MLFLLPLLSHFAVVHAAFPAGVIATGTQGVTNPPVPTMPTTINQTSMARLLSVNSIDDFCLFAPPTGPAEIPDTEELEVAWCTKPRNNARVIPDGVITGISFLKTDFYVQIMGTGDFTKLNIAAGGDGGGELDPHGATGAGNPIGGNVTTTVADGLDEPIAEWMLYMANDQFCLRACTNANSTYSAAFMCWHELDVMGCEFVMPGTYHGAGTFETCEAEVAYPPGWYPTVVDGTTSFSTFAQYFTGINTGADGQPTPYTVGDTITPDAPFSTPSSSKCVTQATVSNGIPASLLTAGAIGTAPPPGFSSSGASAASGSQATAGGSSTKGATSGKTTAGSTPTNSGSASPSNSGTTGSSGALRNGPAMSAGDLVGIIIAGIFVIIPSALLFH